jgi:O-acetyl-ADP-ribose deacetylase (regulator of RNase III)
MIKYVTKDITTVRKGIVAHGVNCQHAMGSGVAKAIKEKWPAVYEQFMKAPKGKKMLGVASIVTIRDTLYIANLYTQNMYGYGGGKYASVEAVRQSLSDVIILADYYSLPLFIPKIGCGLGGLDWDKEVKPVLENLNTFFDQVKINVCELGE